MDPLTVFGLTCNVIQVISFGHEAITLCKRVCRDGSPEPDLAYKSTHLQTLSMSLAESLDKAQNSMGLSKQQINLRETAFKLKNVTTQLNELIGEVTINDYTSRRKGAANTVKYLLRYKSKIQSLEKALGIFQNTLNTESLVHLW